MEYVHLLVIFYIKNFLTFLRLVFFVYNSTFHYQNFFMAKEIIHFFKLHDERKKTRDFSSRFPTSCRKISKWMQNMTYIFGMTPPVLALGEISCHFHPSDSTQYLYQKDKIAVAVKDQILFCTTLHQLVFVLI